MHWLDWIIICIPLLAVVFIGLKSQKYVRSVADFLAASRVAGRYVICVAEGEAGMGLITLVAVWQVYYSSGFAYSFWGSLTAPLGLLFGLFGYCTYRFRETRAMTMGQFLEMRYNRAFRVFAAILQSISGIINYAIFPAVGARCIIYFLNLPLYFYIGGFKFSTFILLMLLFLSVAVWIVTMGGQITIMVTDCVQGLVSYPLYALVVGYLIYRFSYYNEVVPSLMNRPEGMSMLNPYDVGKMRTFNLFYVFVGIFSSIFTRLTWSGSQGYKAAARNAHEQKMGSLLGSWRGGFAGMMYTLLAIAAFTCMKHPDFKPIADKVNVELSSKTVEEFASDERFDPIREDMKKLWADGTQTPKVQRELTRAMMMDEKSIFASAVRDAVPRGDITIGVATDGGVVGNSLRAIKDAKYDYDPTMPLDKTLAVPATRTLVSSIDPKIGQSMGAITNQMTVPVALREILPIGITGALCALMLFLMLSTDTTYLHSWGSILAQDIILPFRKKPFTPKQQLLLLRVLIISVAVFSFFFSIYFTQVDYVVMFQQITGAIWMGGAGPVITFGLYWKRGTTAGAFTSLIVGSLLSVGGMLGQQFWTEGLYDFLVRHELAEPIGKILASITRFFTFGKYELIHWEMTPNAFPINSQELLFISLSSAIILYVGVSLLTSHKPKLYLKKDDDRTYAGISLLRNTKSFNMDKLLHRGAYADADAPKKLPWTWRTVYNKLIGIDGNYTTGDKILAWSVFIWSFGWSFCCVFLGIVTWNAISPWPVEWWAHKFLITTVIIPGVIAIISTVWFSIGGVRDLRRLFRDLAKKQDDFSDDGRVDHSEDKGNQVKELSTDMPHK